MHDVVVDVASKVLDLCSVGIDDLGLPPLKCWDELGDVEDLCVVEDAGLYFLRDGVIITVNTIPVPVCIYGLSTYSEAERLVSVVATILQVGPISKLLLGGEVEDGLANGKLSMDLVLA